MSTLGVLVVLAFDDQVLLDAARSGDADAMDTLYRQHSPAVRRVALALDPGRADDLVSEAFTRVFTALRSGRGPDRNLLGYLATTVRRLHLDHQRTGNHETPSSDRDWLLDRPHTHDLLDPVDERRAAEALNGLPKRWREVLWCLDVEDMSVAEVAERLDVPAPRVSTWAYRAREALRRGYLRSHVAPAERLPCRWTRERLSVLVRDGLSPSAHAKVMRHLDECPDCAAQHAVLDDINDRLGAWIWPVVLCGFAGLPAAAWPGGLRRDQGSSTGSASSAVSGPVVAGAVGVAGVAALVAALVVLSPTAAPSDAEAASPPGSSSTLADDGDPGETPADQPPRPASDPAEHVRPAASSPAGEPTPASDDTAEVTLPLIPWETRPTNPPAVDPETGPGPDPEPEPEEPHEEPQPMVLTGLAWEPIVSQQISEELGIWSTPFAPVPTVSGEDASTIPITAVFTFPDQTTGFIDIDARGWTCDAEAAPGGPAFVPDPVDTPFLGPGSPPLICTVDWDTSTTLAPLVFQLQPVTIGEPPSGIVDLSGEGVDPVTTSF
ncbi:sigma-70 family RNA polymerase sigma factor [Aeromicrobium piscarium]|uniref:Sigma-70 family RNA polymerase sigma factor n=1 Tax=Aeromicrobium piscarium TaxID=2590901 RepID=A0A554SNY2_9ACTN|nr:sigma-70 family RNA polymerase sigma factor [Aeromicrobium piscarium]TSD68028.1 sigma-70 family RNA polymerase sigma factor [Aeromicrobium piscarium]